jgi:hypothetical protein
MHLQVVSHIAQESVCSPQVLGVRVKVQKDLLTLHAFLCVRVRQKHAWYEIRHSLIFDQVHIEDRSRRDFMTSHVSGEHAVISCEHLRLQRRLAVQHSPNIHSFILLRGFLK